MVDFTDRTALVVGGTTGIGHATVLAFARAGANVVVAGRGAEQGRDTEAQITAMGRRALFVEVDVAREADMRRLMEQTTERFGRVDAAVNNAGIEGKVGPIQDASEKDFDALVGVNLKGVWLGLKYQTRTCWPTAAAPSSTPPPSAAWSDFPTPASTARPSTASSA